MQFIEYVKWLHNHGMQSKNNSIANLYILRIDGHLSVCYDIVTNSIKPEEGSNRYWELIIRFGVMLENEINERKWGQIP